MNRPAQCDFPLTLREQARTPRHKLCGKAAVVKREYLRRGEVVDVDCYCERHKGPGNLAKLLLSDSHKDTKL